VAIRIPEDARWPVRDLARRIALGLSRRGWVCAVVRRGADGRERAAEETSRDGRFDDLWWGVVAGDEAVRVELERDLHVRAHGIGGTQEWAPETGAYPAEGASLLRLAPDPDYFFPVRAPARPMRTVLAFLDGAAGDRVVRAVSRLSKRVSGLRLVGLRSHPVPESPSVWTEPVRSLSADGIVEIRHFHWADAVQRLGAYRAADLAVIAGGGPEEALASLELAACALPILAAPGTLPGALDGEGTSFRLPDRSAEAIEEWLEEMLSRPDRSRLRGWRASRVVLRRSWTAFLDSFEERLSTIAGAGAPP
jgi:glycosyltransferase involved in cell wall biosynthesis